MEDLSALIRDLSSPLHGFSAACVWLDALDQGALVAEISEELGALLQVGPYLLPVTEVMFILGYDMTSRDGQKTAMIAAHWIARHHSWEPQVVGEQSARVSCVYFLRHGDHIKIGTTMQSPHLRMRGMSPPPGTELIGSMPGDATTEAQLHHLFAADRVRGEWFRATPDLLAFIEERTSSQ